ncbi:MAG: methylmalonyl Co-A mutase-associated GTPase MeaB [Deltaproteobacteria bacterium]|nr:methylmalonyl Co-A mutase-associated GTPase MeaB [Deltaproteobacteria bacterium]
MHPLAQRVVEGDLRAAARVMRLIDDRAAGHVDILKDLYPHVGKAWLVGVTGTPGAGKSTLVDRLIATYRKEGKRVGVVAVDPTSPFSGGAILGDRIRMQRHFTDEGVFIRSVATRGALGGLSRSAIDVARVLDAYGCDVVLIETVGVGQDELDVTRSAHTTLVVVPPGGGDDVQANKAGILEVADVFVVNKADREGADAQVRHLESMIALGREIKAGRRAVQVHIGHHAGALGGAPVDDGSWSPPVLKTVAARGEGVDALCAEIVRHRAWLETDAGRERRARQQHEQLLGHFRDTLIEAALSELGAKIDEAARSVQEREIDPYTASEGLIAAFRTR